MTNEFAVQACREAGYLASLTLNKRMADPGCRMRFHIPEQEDEALALLTPRPERSAELYPSGGAGSEPIPVRSSPQAVTREPVRPLLPMALAGVEPHRVGAVLRAPVPPRSGVTSATAHRLQGDPYVLHNFHCHTTLSDGVLSPMELIRRFAHAGYRTVAITDHAAAGSLERMIAEAAEDGEVGGAPSGSMSSPAWS